MQLRTTANYEYKYCTIIQLRQGYKEYVYACVACTLCYAHMHILMKSDKYHLYVKFYFKLVYFPARFQTCFKRTEGKYHFPPSPKNWSAIHKPGKLIALMFTPAVRIPSRCTLGGSQRSSRSHPQGLRRSGPSTRPPERSSSPPTWRSPRRIFWGRQNVCTLVVIVQFIVRNDWCT